MGTYFSQLASPLAATHSLDPHRAAIDAEDYRHAGDEPLQMCHDSADMYD
jgi:hypothetical protein